MKKYYYDKEYKHNYYLKNKTHMNNQSKAYYMEHMADAKSRSKQRYDELAKKILMCYGAKCTCLGCMFDDLDLKVRNQRFLQIDHINGGGSHETSGSLLYKRIKNKGFPLGFRDLCGACNVSMNPGEKICEYHKWQRHRFDSVFPSDLYQMET